MPDKSHQSLIDFRLLAVEACEQAHGALTGRGFDTHPQGAAGCVKDAIKATEAIIKNHADSNVRRLLRERRSTLRNKPKYYSTGEVSDILGIGEGSLGRMRKLGTGPAFMKVGNRFRYGKEQLDKWVRNKESRPKMGRPITSKYKLAKIGKGKK